MASPAAGTRRAAAVLACLSLLLAGCAGPKDITAVAPYELEIVLKEAAVLFRDRGGGRVTLRPGRAADLAAAVGQGAAADLWFCMDPAWTDTLQARALLRPGMARVLAWDSLVAVVPAGRGPAPGNQYLLPNYGRIAVADTLADLRGRGMKQGLAMMGVWNALRDRVVVCADAPAALAMVERGEVDAAILPATLARRSSRVEVGFKLSEGTHEVLACTGAVLSGARHPEAAAAFLEFLSGPSGREILRRHGFLGVDPQ